MLLLLTFSIKAQSTICQSEIGFITTDFDNYGITCKIGSDSYSLWRYGADMSFTYGRGKQSGDGVSEIDGKSYIPGINLVAISCVDLFMKKNLF
jgi:hypothetical protein